MRACVCVPPPQEFGFCGAQYAPDVKLLWNYTEGVGPASTAPAGFCYSGPKQPIAVMHSRLRTESIALRVQEDFVHTMQATQQLVSKSAVSLPPVDVGAFHINTAAPVPFPVPSDPNDNMHYRWIDPAPGGNAYAYSLYYVYYDQYNYIRGVALQSILLALGAVFVAIVWISTPAVAVVVVLCVFSVAVDLVGFIWMLNPPYSNDPSKTHVFGVDVNAVSVVNIITAVGLSVEFCVHIATSFVGRQGVCLCVCLCVCVCVLPVPFPLPDGVCVSRHQGGACGGGVGGDGLLCGDGHHHHQVCGCHGPGVGAVRPVPPLLLPDVRGHHRVRRVPRPHVPARPPVLGGARAHAHRQGRGARGVVCAPRR